MIRNIANQLRFQFWRARDAARERVWGSAHRKAIFERIYTKNLWGDQQSVSGPGSAPAATAMIRLKLPSLFQNYGIRTVLDAPCGDFSWMKDLVNSIDRYVGADIVSDLVTQNEKSFGSESVSFICADIAMDPLPTADLIICRDCFIHLPTRTIWGALSNFRSTGARYLLVTSDRNVAAYHDIPLGSFRSIDFSQPPFSFPTPLCTIDEEESGRRQLCLWDLRSLPLR